jgi:HEPN domain-containing protein
VAQEETGVVSSEENVREWVAYAERDRRAARHLLESGDYEACALHCQQAVEKLLKAGIVSQTGERPPYEHNLWKLAQAIDGLTIPDEMADKLASLNPHYFGSRYPVGIDMGYDEALARELLAKVDEVFLWLTKVLNLPTE